MATHVVRILWKSTLNSSNVIFRLDLLELRDNVCIYIYMYCL